MLPRRAPKTGQPMLCGLIFVLPYLIIVAPHKRQPGSFAPRCPEACDGRGRGNSFPTPSWSLLPHACWLGRVRGRDCLENDMERHLLMFAAHLDAGVLRAVRPRRGQEAYAIAMTDADAALRATACQDTGVETVAVGRLRCDVDGGEGGGMVGAVRQTGEPRDLYVFPARCRPLGLARRPFRGPLWVGHGYRVRSLLVRGHGCSPSVLRSFRA